MSSSFSDLSWRYFSHSDLFQSSFKVKVINWGYVQSGIFSRCLFPSGILSRDLFQSGGYFPNVFFNQESFSGVFFNQRSFQKYFLSGIISKRFSGQVFSRGLLLSGILSRDFFSVRELFQMSCVVRGLCKWIRIFPFQSRAMFILESIQTSCSAKWVGIMQSGSVRDHS